MTSDRSEAFEDGNCFAPSPFTGDIEARAAGVRQAVAAQGAGSSATPPRIRARFEISSEVDRGGAHVGETGA
jgi:hypothetical protein